MSDRLPQPGEVWKWMGSASGQSPKERLRTVSLLPGGSFRMHRFDGIISIWLVTDMEAAIREGKYIFVGLEELPEEVWG